MHLTRIKKLTSIKKIQAHAQIYLIYIILWSKSSNFSLNCGYLTIEWIQVTKL